MRIKRSSACMRLALILLLAIMSTAEARKRDQTDVVVMDNGDRVTCRIIGLQYGLLQADTYGFGIVSIKWESVATVESPFVFDVEVLGAVHHYGTLTPAKDGKRIVITGDTGTMELDPAEITRIAEVDSGFWKRIHGSLSVGSDFTKSSDVGTNSLSLTANYRAETFVMNLDLNLQQTKSPDSGTTDRDKLGFAYQWLRPNRNFWVGLGALERNEELGIDARVELGGGFGRYLKQTSASEFSAVAGLVATREWVTGAGDSQQSIEGVLAATWHVFHLVGKTTSLSTQAMLYPSITESGRYRGELDITLRKELIKDFNIDINAYYDYDNQPPDQDKTETSDYGWTMSLSYAF
jgi:Protein of unknown function, DUF481